MAAAAAELARHRSKPQKQKVDLQRRPQYWYQITGSAARARLEPLLPPNWTPTEDDDFGGGANDGGGGEGPIVPDLLWENAPRRSARRYRDSVACHSHLPNGTSILDDKWALARLLSPQSSKSKSLRGVPDASSIEMTTPTSLPSPSVLESHCFRGPDGFDEFARRVGLLVRRPQGRLSPMPARGDTAAPAAEAAFPDLRLRRRRRDDYSSCLPPTPDNLWVIKDAGSNGAGGVWVVSPRNASIFSSTAPPSSSSSSMTASTPLIDDHRYVAQRYAWPPALYGGRKCHVRAYGLITSDGRAFLHRRCFLHVANEPFAYRDDCDHDHDGAECGGHSVSIQESSGAIKDKTTPRHPSDQSDSPMPTFDDSVHITNCCANSHDPSKFAGEICADFGLSIDDEDNDAGGESNEYRSTDAVVPLAEFLPSASSSLAALAERSLPFVRGGDAHCGFEYLGLDFILSYHCDGEGGSEKGDEKGDRDDEGTGQPSPRPVAYLLEVNAPPSQDTATGLDHAERLHDEVLRDLLSLWVLPAVTGAMPQPGGWSCVYDYPADAGTSEGGGGGGSGGVVCCGEGAETTEKTVPILPSKAAILNKVRWAIYERKAAREYEEEAEVDAAWICDDASKSGHVSSYDRVNATDSASLADVVALFARSQFPYFQRPSPPIFLENAGGTQVPFHVIHSVTNSLGYRHRSGRGAQSRDDARKTMLTLLGGDEATHLVFLGSNATSLLDLLARRYVESGTLCRGDEVVISTENHLANVTPWLQAAKEAGAKVRWWMSCESDVNDEKNGGESDSIAKSSPILTRVLSSRTRIVAVSHASNVLGELRHVRSICNDAERVSNGRAHVVVDGVAAAPHVYPDVAGIGAHWYAVSCHKMFGPHLGVICGRRETAREVLLRQEGEDLSTYWNGRSHSGVDVELAMHKALEFGTANFEGCAGVNGLGEYFLSLAKMDAGTQGDTTSDSSIPRRCDRQTSNQCTESQRDREEDTVTDGFTRTDCHLPLLCEANAGSGENSSIFNGRPLLTSFAVKCAYERIRVAEAHLVGFALPRLRSHRKVRVIEDGSDMCHIWEQQRRIPVISFIHDAISSDTIVQLCRESGIVCRSGTFLATDRFIKERRIAGEGVVRISLAHFNTVSELHSLFACFESMVKWH